MSALALLSPTEVSEKATVRAIGEFSSAGDQNVSLYLGGRYDPGQALLTALSEKSGF
jgi:hypothetical protein